MKDYYEEMLEKLTCDHGTEPFKICLECDAEYDAAVKACDEAGGHDFECNADVGPDSGSETFSCKLCPANHLVTYY